MPPDLWSLYGLMLRSRLFEEAIAKLWREGLISGEMHLGTGEEAVCAGLVTQLQDGDAMALDHRGTAPLFMRGVNPRLILRELLGYADGLCGGMGGHMHLFSKAYLAASSGIVGSAGPAAAGFALSAQYVRPGSIALAFFGEGAMNQGMLLESMNLAAVWKLPVLFVCRDDRWSITTQSDGMTGGDLNERAQGLGLPAMEVDGLDVLEVWEASRTAIARARAGEGPTFLHARCIHLEAHFLGYQLIRMIRHPLTEIPRVSLPLTRSFLSPGGATVSERLAGMKMVLESMLSTLRDPRRDPANDPLHRARAALQPESSILQQLEDQALEEIHAVLESALAEVKS